MSWVYVPGPAASNSESKSPNPEAVASVWSRGRPMRVRYWSLAWRRGGWIRRLSGLTSEPSTAARGAASWIASLRATRASRTVRPDSEGARTTTDGSSTRCSGSSRKCGLPLSSARTYRGTPTGNSPLWFRVWKDWATALREDFSARPKPERRTFDSDCSSWPTPTRGDNEGRSAYGRGNLALTGMAKSWPTPTASDFQGGQNPGHAGESRLRYDAVNWATPIATDATKIGPGTKQTSVVNQARMWAVNWPTPAARDWKGTNSPEHVEDGSHMDPLANFAPYAFTPPDQTIPHGEGSSPKTPDSPPRPQLNPRFAEWVMGYPDGWTDCGPLATESCRWLPLMRGRLSEILSVSEAQGDMFA